MKTSIEMIDGGIDEEIRRFAQECVADVILKYIGFAIDPATFCETLEVYAKDPEKLFLIARVGEKAVGTFLGEIKNYPFTKNKIAVELYFRVSEEFRGQGISKFLIKEFETWAKDKGCRFAICGVNEFSSHATQGANQRLVNENYHLYGKEYFKEL